LLSTRKTQQILDKGRGRVPPAKVVATSARDKTRQMNILVSYIDKDTQSILIKSLYQILISHLQNCKAQMYLLLHRNFLREYTCASFCMFFLYNMVATFFCTCRSSFFQRYLMRYVTSSFPLVYRESLHAYFLFLKPLSLQYNFLHFSSLTNHDLFLFICSKISP
jgi:hypothetical protein